MNWIAEHTKMAFGFAKSMMSPVNLEHPPVMDDWLRTL